MRLIPACGFIFSSRKSSRWEGSLEWPCVVACEVDDNFTLLEFRMIVVGSGDVSWSS